MRRFSAYGPSLIVLVTAIVVLAVGPLAVRKLTYAQTEARIVRASSRLKDSTAILEQLNQAYRDVAQAVEPTVVHISAEKRVTLERGVQRPQLSTGSGWVWDETGHIVTNYHVVQGATDIDVQLHNGELRPATIVGYDDLTDIAVLKIDPGRLFPSARVDRTYDVQQGDLVFAFGSPFDFRFSMSSGVVSGKGRSVGVIRSPLGRSVGYENFIQVDAAINPGNSGGPLTNHRGEVIGMNTAIATQRDSALDEGQFAGIGLAIPMNMIEPVVTQLIDNDGVVFKGYLGVEPRPISTTQMQDLNRMGFVGQGVRVFEVVTDSPADRAGIRVGDIIIEVDGQDVQTTDQLRSEISSMLPDETIVLRAWRPNYDKNTGTSIEFDVTLERLNEIIVRGRLPIDQPSDRIVELGIAKMATATEALARQYGVEEFYQGVLIEDIVKNSYLQNDIHPGTVITSVQDFNVSDVDEFLGVLRQFNLSTTVGLRATAVLPNGNATIINLRLDRP